jgi:hypothetical protein
VIAPALARELDEVLESPRDGLKAARRLALEPFEARVDVLAKQGQLVKSTARPRLARGSRLEPSQPQTSALQATPRRSVDAARQKRLAFCFYRMYRLMMPRRSRAVEEVLPLERRDEIRAREVAAIPRWYSPYGHLGATTGIGVAVLVVAFLRLHHVRWYELLVVPATFLLANGFEWRVHKSVLHRRFKPFELIYERHTPMHHMVYIEGDMCARSHKEWRLVLMPALGILGAVIVASPFAVAAGFLVTANCGWLFLVTASLYMVLYELSHLSYHLSPESFIGRLALVRVLRKHHARHHDPRLMQRWNFNVTIPLFDWLYGTIATDEVVARMGASAASTATPTPTPTPTPTAT